MARGGRRDGAGRKPSAETSRISLSSDLIPLVLTINSIRQFKSEPWAVLLCFVLLGKLIGFPEERRLRFGRFLKNSGRALLRRHIDSLACREREGLPLSPQESARLVELRGVYAMFNGSLPDSPHDIFY